MNETVIERNVNQDTINDLKNLALSHMESVKRLTKEIKEANQMVKDGLTGNAAYHDASEKAKEVTKKKSQVRQQIMSTPEMAGMSAKLKDLKATKREKQQALSDYLLEYERMSGKDVIENLSGDQLHIFKK